MKRHRLVSVAWVLLMSLGYSADAAESQGEFSGFQLASCTANRSRCLTLSAKKALGGHLKALYVLTNPSLEILFRDKGPTQKLIASSGYIDFELQRVVLTTELKSGVFQETIIDLKTLKLSSAVMR